MSTNNQSDGADMEIDTLREQVARLTAERDVLRRCQECSGRIDDGEHSAACFRSGFNVYRVEIADRLAQAERERDEARWERSNIQGIAAQQRKRAETAEARVSELEGALSAALAILEDHDHHDDCPAGGGHEEEFACECELTALRSVLSSPGTAKGGSNG